MADKFDPIKNEVQFFIQDASPGDAPRGSFWFDTDNTKLYLYVDTTQKWVLVGVGTTSTTTTTTTTSA